MHVHDLQEAINTEFPDSRNGPTCGSPDIFLARRCSERGLPLVSIDIRRTEVRPFSERQIKLIETFAAQAVIAIENVRLFKELDERTNELTRSVDELKALGEVGQAVSSTLDLETVLTSIVSHAVQLSGTEGGAIYEYDEAVGRVSPARHHQMEEEFINALAGESTRLGGGVVGRAATSREPVQSPGYLRRARHYAPRMRPMLERLVFGLAWRCRCFARTGSSAG